jgi:hypothetical protein
MAKDILSLSPSATSDPKMFSKRAVLRRGLTSVGLVPGPIKGLGTLGLNCRSDPVFGRLPLIAILHVGTARRLMVGIGLKDNPDRFPPCEVSPNDPTVS